MKRRGSTTISGAGAFQSTAWSEILQAQTEDSHLRQVSMENLSRRYWKPIYCYLRRRGYSNEDAKDLTQGFFAEVLLGRQLVGKADKAKGRFRTFLLTALDRYVKDVGRRKTAKKRAPGLGLVPLEKVGSGALPEPVLCSAPEAAFDYAWASALLDAVLAELTQSYAESGRSAHWEVFCARVLRPIMADEKPVSLPELCRCHQIEDVRAAANMVVTVKRRFRTVLRRHIRQLVRSDEEVDEEIEELIKILSSRSAAP